MPLVFQYGSNVSAARLNSPQRLNGKARVVGPAYTAEPHELDFTVWSDDNGWAAADLLPGEGRAIWGALYEIPEEAIYRDKCPPTQNCLDAIEHEGEHYVRTRIAVCDDEGTLLDGPVITYLGNRRSSGIRTSPGYVGHILTGLSAYAIPDDYLEYVYDRIATNLGITVVKARRIHMPNIAQAPSSGVQDRGVTEQTARRNPR